MKYSTSRAVRYVKRRPRISKRKHHHVKNKKTVHVINGKKVHGIYYKGRFYVQKHHLRKGHVKHHSIKHKGKSYHAVTKNKSSSLSDAWNWVKGKYRVYKQKKAEKKYYKENLSLKEREQVQRDLSRKNPMSVSSSSNVDSGESERLKEQHYYDDKERA